MIRREIAVSLRPIVRSYLLVVAVYYAIQTLLYRVPGDPGWDPSASFTIALISGGLFVWTRGVSRMGPLEIAGHIVNLLVIGVSLLDVVLRYETVKLIYFALLLPVFAVSGARPRVVLPGAAVGVMALLGFAWSREHALFEQYVWIAFTALVTALAMSAVMRTAMLRAVRARVTADRHRDEASTLANFDALTGLPNRRHFFDSLASVLREEQAFDVGLIDLDGFKPVNDVYGHAAGDAVLVEAGRRLRDVCGDGAIVARLGGDEFALILTGLSDGDVRARGQAICEALRRPFPLGEVHANLSGSVGFVHAEAGARFTGAQLLERADYALYHAKDHLRGAVVVFTRDHESEMADFSRLDYALRSGHLPDELHMAFQPLYDAVEKRTIGFEALARWRSPTLGDVPPDVFIPAAERSGLIDDITPLLLNKALVAAAQWPAAIRVSFNLSVRDLHSAGNIERICAVVREAGVDPSRIEFEIKEAALLTDFDQALLGIENLKGLGVRIALDHFGSGYSSFGSLHRLPVDVIKIDRDFIVQLGRHKAALKIIKTIIDLGRNLGLDCVVEGIETQADMARLLQVRARYMQGYLICRPMPPEAIAGFLAAESEDAKASLAG